MAWKNTELYTSINGICQETQKMSLGVALGNLTCFHTHEIEIKFSAPEDTHSTWQELLTLIEFVDLWEASTFQNLQFLYKMSTMN